MLDTKRIRNYAIIAHIDHGKSTLADQFLLKTGAITARDFRAQVLDDMDLERERGITIQMHPVTIYHNWNSERYELNLIDTPGHVDFHYEVSRALAACEGVLVLVDSTQGVQAQTVANAYAALEVGCDMILVINKIDLPAARPEDIALEAEQVLGLDSSGAIFTSGKTGAGMDELFAAIIQKIRPPAGNPDGKLKALIYDAKPDVHRGVICHTRVYD